MGSQNKNGSVFVISGPSGVGKGTLCKRLLTEDDNLVLSISATSRPKRPHEEEGRDYFFKTREAFEDMIRQGEMLEWAEYNGNYYGTPKSHVESVLSSGRHILLEIEVQGALQVKEKFPEARLIFITPPSMEELAARLKGRATDDAEVIEQRLKISEQELTQQDRFDLVIINDDLEACCSELQRLITPSDSR